mmetsp:Transcript_192/g.345  ORF Transcript_192/g.345 Transcript_192/m.345 type:complete len:217 (-) Transcript_192:209-859(-)
MELMVDLPLVEWKLVRVVDPNFLRAHGVGIVALAPHQLEAPGVGSLDGLEGGPVHAAWNSNGRPVLRAAVLGVSPPKRILLCRVEVGLREVAHLVLGHVHVHHLGVPKLSVVSSHRHVVVADLALAAHLLPTGIARQSSDFCRLSGKTRCPYLLLHNLVLHMPKAALAHVHVHTGLCHGSPRRGHDCKAGHSGQQGTCPRLHPGVVDIRVSQRRVT